MKTESRQKYRKSFKGSVLFTVLVVMVVMLIMMITTIGLASAASRRAYSEYFDHQTTSTARSVVDTVINSLKSDNQTLGENIVSSLKGSHGSVEVKVNDGNDLGEGLGTVDKLVFSYVASDDASGINITGSGKPIIKVTATVTQGGVTSTYSQYAIGEKKGGNVTSSGGGLIALGGFEGAAQPGVDAKSPAYFGVNTPFTYDKKLTLSNPNKGSMSSLVANSSAELKTGLSFFLNKGEGVSIMGNAEQNDGTAYIKTFLSTADYINNVKSGSITKISDNPYLYVGGALYIHNTLSVDDAPVNIYCGRLDLDGNGEIKGNANIYCYNDNISDTASYDRSNAETYAKNSWSRLGTNNLTQLLSWAKTTFTDPTSADYTTYAGSAIDTGNIFTLGNMELTKKVKIANDLYVKGNVNAHDIVSGDSKIGGNIYVEGSISGVEHLTGIVDGFIYNGSSDSTTYPKVKAYPSTPPAKITTFLTGDISKANLTSNVVLTPTAVKDQFYKDDPSNPGNKVFKDAINKSNLIVDAGTKVYDEVNDGGSKIRERTMDQVKKSENGTYMVGGKVAADFSYAVKITDSCVLKGRFEHSIYIEPSSDIWINLHNFDLYNGAEMLINDRNGKVNFFLPTGVSEMDNVTSDYAATYSSLLSNHTHNGVTYSNHFITNSQTKIITLDYYEKMKQSNQINLVTYPTNDTDTNNDWMLPKVGFYAAEKANVLVHFTNNVLLTGDICMPGADFYSKSGCYQFGEAPLYYNGKKIDSGRVGCIGSIIVGKIKEFNNDYGMAYVDDPSTEPPIIGGGGVYEWNLIEGFADY